MISEVLLSAVLAAAAAAPAPALPPAVSVVPAQGKEVPSLEQEFLKNFLRDQKAIWHPVEGKPAPGDRVNVVLATAEEDGTMSEGHAYPLVLGERQAIPGIEELIMELSPSETEK